MTDLICQAKILGCNIPRVGFLNNAFAFKRPYLI